MAGKRPQQQRGLKTRDRLLKIAARCLVDEGIHALRFSHIAKQAKIPQALIGYHFPTTELLLMAVIQAEIEKLKAASVESVERWVNQPKKALAEYIRAPFRMAEDDLEFRAVWTALYHLCTVTPAFADLNHEVRKVGRERILNLITMVFATEGRFIDEPKLSREQLVGLALTVQAVITGHILMTVTEPNSDYDKMAERAVKTCFEILKI